jgi:hypothetical protein
VIEFDHTHMKTTNPEKQPEDNGSNRPKDNDNNQNKGCVPSFLVTFYRFITGKDLEELHQRLDEIERRLGIRD